MRSAALLLALAVRGAIARSGSVGSAPAPAFQLSVNAGPSSKGLGYTVSVDGREYLVGRPLQTVHMQGAETPLVYKSMVNGTGSDAVGLYHLTATTWDVGGTNVIAEFREYRESTPPAIVFSLKFPDGAATTARPNGDSTPLAAFPSFASEGGMLGGLGYRSWSGNMCADSASTFPLNYSQMTNDPDMLATINSIANGPIALYVPVHYGHKSVPLFWCVVPFISGLVSEVTLCFRLTRRSFSDDVTTQLRANPNQNRYEEHDGTTLFISPHSEFMTEQHRATPGAAGSLWFGPGGELTSLPAGFKQETILVVGGNGTNRP